MTTHFYFPLFLRQVRGKKEKAITAQECDVNARMLRADH
jgi:hypothetical protein